MTHQPIALSPVEARRLAIRCQGLDAQPQSPDADDMLTVFRRLGCVQIDPINVVARSPLLVLWSRLGNHDQKLLDQLMWEERLLFEYWAHAASIVLVEDFPIHQQQMVNFSRGDSAWARRVRDWLAANEPFRCYILEELRQRGPLFTTEIEDCSSQPWESSGWTSSRNVSMMLGLMWEQGDITVTLREGDGFGLKKQWGLMEQHMPQWQDHEPLPRARMVEQAAERSLKALGVGTAAHIGNHFIRGSYPGLPEVLVKLEQDGRIRRAQISENGSHWPGDWYIHVDVLPDLERIRSASWYAPVALLSPFDNLIADRDRTETLFDFFYRSEIYTPKAKRIYGYYVLPILAGDRLIGRIDPKMDRKTGTLTVYAVHQEPGAPGGLETGGDIHESICSLGRFLGAERVAYGNHLPDAWRASFRDGPC